MNEYKEKIYDAKTGEITWRDFTNLEVEQAKLAESDFFNRISEQEKKQSMRQSALNKLIDLGLTEEEIASL